MTIITQGFIDYSGEKSSTTWHVAPPDVGDDFTDAISAANNVQGAIGVVTLCNFTKLNMIHNIETDVPSLPANASAQREMALWIQYVDDTDGTYQSMSIPAPDLPLLAQANTDEVDIVANITAAALVLVLEANVKSENDNPITVTRMRIIGRSN